MMTWKICGKAGEGIMATGLIYSQICAGRGLYVFDINEYPSLIKGGHNSMHVRVHENEIHSQVKRVDLLIALNEETIDMHKDDISPGGCIIFDGESIDVSKKNIRNDIKLYSVPYIRLVKEIGADYIMKNNVALGASLAVAGFDFKIATNVISKVFKRKGEKIINENVTAAGTGFDYIKKNYPDDFAYKLKVPEKIPEKKRMLLTGNDAICMGAIRAGCKFYAAYPMTPVSSILHFMAANEQRFSIVVKHTEDEISAINSAIGAGFTGVRAMCATSGGGFCLMSEGYSLAAEIEVPVVIIEGMRPGPSTGMPTWTEQGDLRFVLGASQGDFPRVVMAAGDIEECFYLTGEAFNIAEKYQTPVILVTDKYLAESHMTLEKFDPEKITIDRGLYALPEDMAKTEKGRFFARYRITESGISPRSLPGQKDGLYTATSDEHDETGDITEESDMRIQMMDKRMRKMEGIGKELKNPELSGPKDADATIIGWGSTKGPIIEAMKLLENDGIKVNYLQIRYLSPFPTETVEEVMKSAKMTVMVENNYTGQMAGLIREKTGLSVDHKILKYDGRPFYPEEIHERVKEVISVG